MKISRNFRLIVRRGVRKKLPRQLHGQGAPTLHALPRADIRYSRREDAKQVYPMVGEKLMIFGRQDSVDHHRRQILVSHQSPLAATAVKQGGNKLRFNW